MKILILSLILFLTACAGPGALIERRFPNIPPSLTKGCSDLELVPMTDKLSEVLRIITINYGKYHECSIQVETWHSWYHQQREIFESVK